MIRDIDEVWHERQEILSEIGLPALFMPVFSRRKRL